MRGTTAFGTGNRTVTLESAEIDANRYVSSSRWLSAT